MQILHQTRTLKPHTAVRNQPLKHPLEARPDLSQRLWLHIGLIEQLPPERANPAIEARPRTPNLGHHPSAATRRMTSPWQASGAHQQTKSLVAKPALVHRDHLVARTVASDHERIRPFGRSKAITRRRPANIDRVGRHAAALDVQDAVYRRARLSALAGGGAFGAGVGFEASFFGKLDLAGAVAANAATWF
jgi:hypothetical protein